MNLLRILKLFLGLIFLSNLTPSVSAARNIQADIEKYREDIRAGTLIWLYYMNEGISKAPAAIIQYRKDVLKTLRKMSRAERTPEVEECRTELVRILRRMSKVPITKDSPVEDVLKALRILSQPASAIEAYREDVVRTLFVLFYMSDSIATAPAEIAKYRKGVLKALRKLSRTADTPEIEACRTELVRMLRLLSHVDITKDSPPAEVLRAFRYLAQPATEIDRDEVVRTLGWVWREKLAQEKERKIVSGPKNLVLYTADNFHFGAAFYNVTNMECINPPPRYHYNIKSYRVLNRCCAFFKEYSCVSCPGGSSTYCNYAC